MKMKAFNLQEALDGKPVVTRSGKQIDKIVRFPHPTLFPLVVHLKGYDSIYQVDENGIASKRYYTGPQSDYDLFMKPTERTVYINVYKLGTEDISSVAFATKSIAEFNADHNTLRVIGRAIPVIISE